MNKHLERVKLRILATLAIVSITLCLITVFLWPLSYVTGVQLSIRNGAGTRYALLTTPGQLGVVTVRGEPPDKIELLNIRSRSFNADTAVANDPQRWFWVRPSSKIGFGTSQGESSIYFQEIKRDMTCAYAGYFMPTWLFALIAFAGPTWWYFARRRREYRLETGLCMYCGSDMSASPYRCPDCGKEPPW